MSQVNEIPVRVVDRPVSGPVGGGVYAVLYEILSRMQTLEETGEGGVIDLRTLPLTGNDKKALAEALGPGEVSATLSALGETEVRETSYHGVWWVTHRNDRNEIVAESIEITDFPQILASPAEDVREDLEALRLRLDEFSAQARIETPEA